MRACVSIKCVVVCGVDGACGEWGVFLRRCAAVQGIRTPQMRGGDPAWARLVLVLVTRRCARVCQRCRGRCRGGGIGGARASRRSAAQCLTRDRPRPRESVRRAGAVARLRAPQTSRSGAGTMAGTNQAVNTNQSNHYRLSVRTVGNTPHSPQAPSTPHTTTHLMLTHALTRLVSLRRCQEPLRSSRRSKSCLMAAC